MDSLRHRPKGMVAVAFALGLLGFGVTPSPLGYQDLGALIASQPAVAERGRQHILGGPLSPVHASVFSFPRPIGTAIPDPAQFRLAGLSVGVPDATGAIPNDPISPHAIRPASPAMQFPSVNRALKGDLLAKPAPEMPADEPQHDTPLADHDTQLEAEIDTAAQLPSLGVPVPEDEEAPNETLADAQQSETPLQFHEENPSARTASLFFGADFAPLQSALEPWAPGEAPVLMAPRAPVDSDVKVAALTPQTASPASGQTIAGKGEVTGEGKRPKTPAERLGLSGAKRAKAEKCLANAIYFESRGEEVRGQIAVAQVVLNRAFSGYYPSDVCGVVYQNAHRHLSCQFTFACDGIRDVVREHEAWDRATRIAKDTLDGKLWLNEVDKSTHYHAYWVRPSWVRTMKTMHKLGVHTFYRPRRWGKGTDAPSWGDPVATVEAAKTL